MSLSFSNSEVAVTDVAEPLTSSPITRALDDTDPSATRTTLTSEPFADNPSDKAALNVASPHGVGGYVLRMPKLAGPEGSCPTSGVCDVARVDRALKVIPTDGCHRCVRRELLLCEISGGRLTSSRTGWVPNLTEDTPDDRLSRIEPGQDAQADRVPELLRCPRCQRRPISVLGELHHRRYLLHDPAEAQHHCDQPYTQGLPATR